MGRRREPWRFPGDPTDPFGFCALVADWAEWMGAHGYSPRTIENRQRMLAHLVVWLDERGVTRPVDVTRPMLERYQRWLFHYRKRDGNPLTFRSQSQRLLPVRAFFKWAARQHHLVHNPASELELPKVEKRLPRSALTAAEAEQVLSQPDLSTPAGVRDRAMLEVLYSTGIRRIELAGLAVFDIDHDRHTLLVRQGKGRKDRLIPIGERALVWIDRYHHEARPHWAREPDNSVLFLTANGDGFSLDRLTQLARHYVTMSGVGKQGACHLFRHTLATLMLEGGADLRYVQQMLGHADISTTQIYTHVSIRHLQAIHTATHPAATNTPRAARQVHPVHRPPDSEGQVLSAAALLSALELEDDEENRPPTGPPDPDDGGFKRTIVR
jgi:integrase/recombinase XerD